MDISNDLLQELIKQLREQNNNINQLSSKMDVLNEKLDRVGQNLKFNTDRQYYFNAFFNPELLKLQQIPDHGILLCGNYGNPNTGDEWMLDTMISYLHKYSKKNITIMLEPNRIFDPSIYLKYGVHYIHYPQTVYDYDIIVNKFDILIFGGGAIVEDTVYYEAYDYGVNICRTVVDLPLRFITQNKRVICIGLSTSTYLANQDYIRKLETVIDKSTFFSVRDKYSLEVLKQAGICTEKVHLIHDIVYANDKLKELMEDEEIIQKLCRENSHFPNWGGTSTIHIGIVYIVSEETKPQFFELIAKLKTYLKLIQKDYVIQLIPFYDSWHIDLDFYHNVVQGEDKIEILPYNTDIEFMIRVFCNQDVMICARYHAILLSLCLGIPCVALYYDTHQHYYNKISYLLEQFGFCLDNAISISDLKLTDEPIIHKALISQSGGKSATNLVNMARAELGVILEDNL